MTIRPLDGITVLALEHAVAAPVCTRHLADQGARVIKIERPQVGDFARAYDQRVLGQSSYFIWANRSKESLTLDVKHPEAAPLLQALLSQADVLVQNLAPGAAARLGLSFEQLQPRYPKLIVCDISGYGDSGPYRDKKAYDLMVQAEAGLLAVTGEGEMMARAGFSAGDVSAGMYAYSGVLNALLLRGRTGLGSRVDVVMLETLAEWMGNPMYFTHDGQDVTLLATHWKAGKPMFVIRDATAGSETYAASRFLIGDPAGDTITLDFNRAHNPPCAFTDFAICPLPPRENRLSFPIRAGERKLD